MKLLIDGTVGQLEVRYSEAGAATGVTAVLCHPHPQFGGTMNDRVLDALEAAVLASGISSLRFNFRGVGGSGGSYGDGLGEVDDVVAVTNWVRERSVGERIILVGYSFGGAVALSAQNMLAPECLILVAPALGFFDHEHPPTLPSLVILAENDQFVKAELSKDWFAAASTWVKQIPDTDHFFVKRHDQITKIVREFLVTTFAE